jgi:amidase
MQIPKEEPLAHKDWQKDDETRHRLIADYTRFFEDWDVILAPIAPTAAFTHRTEEGFGKRTLTVDNEVIAYDQHLVWAGFATLPGLPASAVPLTRSSEGLPIGVQIVGPQWSDKSTLAVAGIVESLNGGFVSPPGY